MKKFFRMLGSGYILILFILLLEIGAVLFLEWLIQGDGLETLHIINLDENPPLATLITVLVYIGVRLIEFIVALIIFFKIVNKDEDPEFKIPWIVGMLLLPLFFSVLFLIFGNHGLNKRDRLIVDATKNT